MVFKKKASLATIIVTMISFNLFGGEIVNAADNLNYSTQSVISLSRNIESTESFETESTDNIDSSDKIFESKLEVSLSELKILSDGEINAQVNLNENDKLKLEGQFFKNDDKNTYYGNVKTDNENYEILHFSITRPGEETPISKKQYENSILNIYVKDIERDKISFFELEIKNDIISKLDEINYKLEDALVEDMYWFTKTMEPEANMEEIEEAIKERATVLKTVTLNPSLTWSYTSGNTVMNLVSKFTIPTKITQSGDQVITEFRVSKHTLTENGVSIKSSGQKITDLKVMLGSNTKILYLNTVGVNGKYTTAQSPFYINFDSSIAIAPGTSIGIRPLYTSSNYRNTSMVPVNAYRLAFEAKKGTSFFELSEVGHYLTTSSLMANSYVGKNFSAQYSFKVKQGVYGKTFTYNSSSMHTTLKSGTN